MIHRQVARRWVALPLAILMIISLVVAGVSGDPIPLGPDRIQSDVGRIASIPLTFVFNLPVNFVMLGLLTLASVRIIGIGRSEFPKDKATLAKMLALSVISISLFGALTDYALLYGASIEIDQGIDQGIQQSSMIEWNLLKWVLAASLIFLSVLAATSLMLRIDLKRSAVIALGLAALNLLMWGALLISDLTVLVALIISLCAVYPTIWLLRRWHARLPTDVTAQKASV